MKNQISHSKTMQFIVGTGVVLNVIYLSIKLYGEYKKRNKKCKCNEKAKSDRG